MKKVLLHTIHYCNWPDIPYGILPSDDQIIYLWGCLGMGYPQESQFPIAIFRMTTCKENTVSLLNGFYARYQCQIKYNTIS